MRLHLASDCNKCFKWLTCLQSLRFHLISTLAVAFVLLITNENERKKQFSFNKKWSRMGRFFRVCLMEYGWGRRREGGTFRAGTTPVDPLGGWHFHASQSRSGRFLGGSFLRTWVAFPGESLTELLFSIRF